MMTPDSPTMPVAEERPVMLGPASALSTFVVGGTIATSPLWIGPTLKQNANAFGSFGVVIGLFAYILIVVTISMVCAVFAPVWAEWRAAGSDEAHQPQT